MKAYKGFDVGRDGSLSCRGYRYEVGKRHVHGGEIVVCESGFHACPELRDVSDYYSDVDSWHEVELGGRVIVCDGKAAASEITVIRAVTRAEIYNRYGYGDGDGDGYGDGYGDGDGDGDGDLYSVIVC
jgi:hypothetical protein